jgi:hypothetical protein
MQTLHRDQLAATQGFSKGLKAFKIFKNGKGIIDNLANQKSAKPEKQKKNPKKNDPTIAS